MQQTKRFDVVRLAAVLLAIVAMASFVSVRSAAAQDDSVTIDLNELNDSGVSGSATLTDNGDGTTTVSIEVDGATGDHPAHIHQGTCDDLNPNPDYPLANVDADGISETDVEVELADLLDGEYAINIHESATNLGVYVACGEIVAADAGDDDAADDDAAADDDDDTGTGGTTTTPSTGVGLTAAQSGSMLFLLALGAAGAFAVGGLTLRRREVRR